MITVLSLGFAVVCYTSQEKDSLQTGVYHEKDIELKIKAEPLLLKFIQYVINFILQRFSKVLFSPSNGLWVVKQRCSGSFRIMLV